MAALSDLIQVNVSTLTATPQQPGFGVPLIVDYHTRFVERIRFYTGLSGMLSDGFQTYDAAYRAASALMSQNPQVTSFAVGRRANAPDLQVDLTPTAANTRAYVVDLIGPVGVAATATFTSDGTATVAEITAGLTSAINAAAVGITATDQTTFVRCKAASAGLWFSVTVRDLSLLAAKQTQADPGVAADMAAIALESNAWYGMMMTTAGSNGTASTSEVGVASVYAEANKKLYFQASQDADILGSGSSDIASLLSAATRFRTSMWYHTNAAEFLDAAVMGSVFPWDPGSIIAAYRQLASVTKDNLTPTHITNLGTKRANWFTDYAGIGLTQPGKVAGNEWIDIIRDRDWYESRLQTLVFGTLANNNKVPFTDAGIALIEAQVRKATREAITAGFLAEGTDAYIVPKAADIASVDRAARLLKTIKVSARVSGAIQMVRIDATITA